VVVYSSKIESWLVLDVAKYQHAPAWVRTDALFQASSTLDACGSFAYSGRRHFEQPHAELAKSLECAETYRGAIILKRMK
jgi:hypothetical protein